MPMCKVVIVRWQDSCGEDGPARVEDMSGPVELVTAGVLVRETPEVVTVAQDWCPEHKDYRNIIHIPPRDIISKEVFVPQGTPDDTPRL